MTVERTSFVSGLDEQNPKSFDMIKEGDDHIRLTKSTLRNTFPRFDRRTEFSAEQLNKLYQWIFAIEDDPSDPESLDRLTVLKDFEVRRDIYLTEGGEDGRQTTGTPDSPKITGLADIEFTTEERSDSTKISDEKGSRALNLRTADLRYATVGDFGSIDGSKLSFDGVDVAVASEGVLTVISKVVTDEIAVKKLTITETMAAGENLEVAGDLTVIGKILRGSDASIKSDIEDLPKQISIDNIRPVRYKKMGKEEYGVIAQEMPEEFSHTVEEFNGLLAVDYVQIIPVLIKEIKELKSELAKLKGE